MSTLVLGAVALAVLAACGGGSEEGAGDNAAAAATPTDVVAADADVRAKVLVVRSGGGFVETALNAGLRGANGSDYDILVVGGGAPLDASLAAQAGLALEGGKAVVLDAAADGSNAAVGDNLKTLGVGIHSIDADAVMVTKASDGGYDIAPIESPQRASKRTQAVGVQSSEGFNTVESLFGLNEGSAK